MTNRHPITGTRTAELKAFGKSLRTAREAKRVTQEDLVVLLGDVAQSSVSAWERGLMEPTSTTVFRIERALGVKPGGLAQHLGYIPAHVRPITKQDVVDAILRDKALDERGRNAVLALYNSLVGVTSTSRRRRSTSA